jgi:uncharacterized protein (TIGR02328 family)
MRLWHKYLVNVLPRKQLCGQLRECVLIAKNISENGNPNHALVNKIMDYPRNDFNEYCSIVIKSMKMRGYKVSESTLNKLKCYTEFNYNDEPSFDIFKNWHNNRYFVECYYNLKEKYDCGLITEKEWRDLKYGVNLYLKHADFNQEIILN